MRSTQYQLHWQALLMLAFLLCAPFSTGETRGFLSTIGDVPLAEGLQELAEGGFVFDKPEGRIVQITAARSADISQAALVSFYSKSLPNLGWQAQQGAQAQSGLLTFARHGEILRLTFSGDLLIFDLIPKSVSQP